MQMYSVLYFLLNMVLINIYCPTREKTSDTRLKPKAIYFPSVALSYCCAPERRNSDLLQLWTKKNIQFVSFEVHVLLLHCHGVHSCFLLVFDKTQDCYIVQIVLLLPKWQEACCACLLPKLFWPIVRKKKFYWSRKTFEIRGWRPRLCKLFEIPRTIYSNSEMSDQFLKKNAFLTCSLTFLRSNIIRTIRIQIGKKNLDLEICRKS